MAALACVSGETIGVAAMCGLGETIPPMPSWVITGSDKDDGDVVGTLFDATPCDWPDSRTRGGTVDATVGMVIGWLAGATGVATGSILANCVAGCNCDVLGVSSNIPFDDDCVCG